MAGTMIAGTALGALGGYQGAKDKRALEVAAYNDRTIKEAYMSGKQIFGVASVNAMKRLQNQMAAEQMARNYARGRINLQKTTENRRQFMSQNQRLTQAATNSMVTAKLGTASGTAERIREQMKHKGAKNWETEFFNNLDAEKALEQQYRNNLNQIDDSLVQADAYIPGLKPADPNTTMALIQGAMGGMAQGAALGSAMGGTFTGQPGPPDPPTPTPSPPGTGVVNTSGAYSNLNTLGGNPYSTIAQHGQWT